MMDGFSAEKAEALLREWTASESLVKHGLAVACCTESYGVREAARLGLLNDFPASSDAMACDRLTTPRSLRRFA